MCNKQSAKTFLIDGVLFFVSTFIFGSIYHALTGNSLDLMTGVIVIIATGIAVTGSIYIANRECDCV